MYRIRITWRCNKTQGYQNPTRSYDVTFSLGENFSCTSGANNCHLWCKKFKAKTESKIRQDPHFKSCIWLGFQLRCVDGLHACGYSIATVVTEDMDQPLITIYIYCNNNTSSWHYQKDCSMSIPTFGVFMASNGCCFGNVIRFQSSHNIERTNNRSCKCLEPLYLAQEMDMFLS